MPVNPRLISATHWCRDALSPDAHIGVMHMLHGFRDFTPCHKFPNVGELLSNFAHYEGSSILLEKLEADSNLRLR
jgi:hypothetical protein